jgi:general secretion pathway protein M
MMGGFGPWWQSRTLREQRLLLAMFGLLAVVLAWLLVVRPLGDAYSAARERHGAAVIALAEAKARAETVALIERERPASLAEPLEMVIGRSANEAGFAVSQLRAEGTNRVVVAMAAVRPQAFFGWVETTAAANGLIVDRLTAGTNSDQTLTVEVAFRARGG